jgi:hypothetical protein
MTTRRDILKWFCEKNCCLEFKRNCKEMKMLCNHYKELSALIADMVEGVPVDKCISVEEQFSEQRQGYNEHCEEVAEYKKQVMEG